MRQLYRWLSLASLCGLPCSTLMAADPQPVAVRYAPATGSPAPTPTDWLRAQAAREQAAAKESGAVLTPSFAERMQAVQHRQQQQQGMEDLRPKPTQWDLQNPGNPSNLVPTHMNGPVAPNTYFGQQFHSWSQIQQPATMTQLPFNQTATTPINQTNLYTAPNVYFGSQFSGWSNVRSGSVAPNAFGGWNYR